MDNKKKIIFFDVYKSGLDFIKPIFDHEKVEICGLFTTDGLNGTPISEIVNYHGWDYIVATFVPESYETIRKLLTNLNIHPGKMIFASHNQIISDDYVSIEPFLSEKCRKVIAFEKGSKDYKGKVIGDYVAVTVEGVSYINSASDSFILPYMYSTHENFAKDTIMRFETIGKERYSFNSKQDLFCDIGANIGTTSIFFKKNVDKNIKILAFEPSKVNYKLLKINMLLNEINEDEYTIVNSAVSDKEGEALFEFNEDNPGASRLSVNDCNNELEKVSVTTLDRYVEENHIDIERIKYIWIDIEGFEPALFKGAEKTLSKIDVPIIIEFSPELYKENGTYEEFLDILHNLYSSFIVTQEDEHVVHPIAELRRYGEYDYQVDIMFFK